VVPSQDDGASTAQLPAMNARTISNTLAADHRNQQLVIS